MPDVESNIKINISATQTTASTNIKKVKTALLELKAVTDELEGGSIGKVAEDISKLSTAIASIDNSKAASLVSVAKSLKELSGVGDINLNIQGLQSATQEAEKSTGLFSRLHNVVTGLGTAFSAMTKPLRESDLMKNAIDPADVKKTKDMVNGITDGLKEMAGLKKEIAVEKKIEIVSPAEKQKVKETKEAVKELSATAENTKDKMSAADVLNWAKSLSQTDLLKRKLDEAVSRLQKLLNAENQDPKAITQAAEAVQKYQQALEKANKVEQGDNTVKKHFDDIGKSADDAENKISSLSDFFNKIKETSFSSTQQSIEGLATKIGNAITPVTILTTTLSALKTVASIAFNFLKGVFSTTLKLGKNLVTVFAKITVALGKISVLMGKAFGKIVLSPLTLLGKALQGVANKLKSVFSGLVRIATYRMFRSFIKMITKGLNDGIQNLYQWSKALDHVFSKTMDLYATDKQYLDNSIAAMLEPIIETLIPMLDQITDKMVDFFNMFNQAMSALAGKSTWTKALKVAKEYDEAAEDATKKTKELKRTLLGFDEINRLEDPNKGSSKKEKKAIDYSSMFEELPLMGTFANFAKKIRELIENGEWYAAGQTLGNKINELLETWDSEKTGKIIAEKINNAVDFARGFLTATNWRKLGSKVAGLINGLFRKINGKNIGKLLANTINGIFSFALGLFESLDTKTIGKQLSDIINGFFAELNWENIGKTVSTGFKTILDIGVNYLKNFDAKTFYNGILTAIRNVEWGEIGNKLAEFLNEAINVINADKISQIIGTLIQGVAEFIKNAVGNLNIGELVTKIITIFTNLLTDGKTIKALSSAANTLLVKASKAISALISNFPTTEIFKAITTFFEGINFGEIGTNIGTALQTAIDKIKPEDIASAISTVVNKAIDLLGSLTGKLNELTTVTLSTEVDENGFETVRKETMTYWEKLGYDIGTALGKALGNIKWDEATETLNNIAVGITTMIKRAIEEADKNGKLSEAIDTVVKGIDWDTIATNLMVIIADVESALHSALWELGKSIGKVIWDAIKDFFMLNAGDFINRLASLFGVVGKAGSAVKGAFTPDQYASGGFPKTGQMFVAREAGAEMVGTIGGKTAVANNADIVTAVSAGVYEAVSAANATESGGSNITVSIDGDSLFNFFVKKHNGTVKQTGVTPLYL